MTLAYIGLGSNLGDRLSNIKRALHEIAAIASTKLTRISSAYDTDPVGPPQPDFLNAACEVETELEARDLLRHLKQIEALLGRTLSDEHWGPRVIDLDLLLYGSSIVCDDDVVIPHAELTNREFVMVPLLEMCPDLELPSGEPLSVYSSHGSNQIDGVRLSGPIGDAYT
ncbi:MAG: 2-amino-4-hydroxy-6-hydroxymethyldihydropteridine diphosphokinase [Actinomycetota bacterium]|nr:2-amino-4-hydroxy-6-hydroxymethyldihydropteridine diphosphokinase [Actinomycetota bacterium]